MTGVQITVGMHVFQRDLGIDALAFCIYLPHVQSTLSTQFHIPFRMLISYGIVFQQYIHSMRFGIRFAFTLT
jgi:hypothetical protein